MPRFDITCGEWHALIKPVIPHASTDKQLPDIGVIRIEVAEWAMYAVATDRYTIAAERHQLTGANRAYDIPPPVHIRLCDAKSSLTLFRPVKDIDVPLHVTINPVTFPVTAAGRRYAITRYAITLTTDDGTRLVLHDQRDATSDPIANWRDMIGAALSRPIPAMAPALNLQAHQLARWNAACRGAERLALFTGAESDENVLILVETHFAAVWKPVRYLETAPAMLADSPWRAELCTRPGFDLRTASGVVTAADTAAADEVDALADAERDVATLFRQPDTADVAESVLGPWIMAEFDGPCSGNCGDKIMLGDKIRADGNDGWLCGFCGTDTEGATDAS